MTILLALSTGFFFSTLLLSFVTKNTNIRSVFNKYRYEIVLTLLFAALNTTAFSLTPYQRNPDEIEANPVTVYNIAKLIFFLLAALICGIPKNLVLNKVISSSPSMPFILLSILMIISSIWSISPILTIGKAYEMVICGIILGSLVIISRNNIDIKRRLWDYLVFLAFIRLIILWAGAIIYPSISFQSVGGLIPQLVGSFGKITPNSSGVLGLIVFSIGLYRFLRKPNLIWISYSFVGVITIIFSQARTSILSAAVALLLILLLVNKVNNKIPIILIITLFIIILSTPNIYNLFSEYIIRGQTTKLFFSLSCRVNIWSEALKLCLEKPILGHSYYAGIRFVLTKHLFDNLSNLDNGFIQVFFELGIVGLTLFFSSYILPVVRLFSIIRNNHKINLLWYTDLCKESLLVITLLFIHAFFGPTIEIFTYSTMFYLIITIVSSLDKHAFNFTNS